MADTTEICNLALSHARQDVTIVNLATDKSTAAIRLRRIYEPTLHRVIQSFPWVFAATEISLALLDKEAYDGFEYVYSIPSDVFEVQKVSVEDALFTNKYYGSDLNLFKVFPSSDGLTKEIHSRFQLAKAYVVKSTQTDNILDPLFVDHFAYELAKQLSRLYNVDKSDRQLLLQEAAQAESKAMESAALQEDVEFDNYNTYVDARGECGGND